MARNIGPARRCVYPALVVCASVTLATFAMANDAAAPQPARHHFSVKDAGAKYQRDNEISEVKLSAAQTDGRFTLLDEYWQPGFAVPPHFHKEHAEVFYVLAGQVEWTVAGEQRVLGPGAMLYIPPDTVHSVKVVGNQPYHGLMFSEPAGYEYNMAREQEYTDEQREQPEVMKKLMQLGDFTPAMTGASGTGAPQGARHHFVMRAAGPTFDRDEVISEVKLSAVQSDGRFSLLDEIWHPGFTVPSHFHAEHSEVFYIVAGEVEWTVGGETRRMGPGSAVYIPPDTAHAVKVLGNKDVHTLMLYEPGGYEYNIERELEYTKEQREQPDVKKKLRALSDFNPLQK